jgi:hypothetical protein
VSDDGIIINHFGSGSNDNPFNPGFGVPPPELAGRGSVRAEFARAFEIGSRDPWYIATLVGDRGVGKTAVLNDIEQRMRGKNWAVIHEQVVDGQPLLKTLLSDLITEAGSQWSRVKKSLREFDLEATLGVNVGVAAASIKARRAVSAPTATQLTRNVLRVIGKHAQVNGVGVLITIDEVQGWADRQELGALASALQLVSKREGLPVAVIFAGLPFSHEVLSGAGTFFERMPFEALGDLSRESTEIAFLKPAIRAGVHIEAEALELLTVGSSGYPYLIQLAGWYSWPAAGSPRTITVESAERGLALARVEINKLFVGRWADCTPMQRAYLWAVASVAGAATNKEIATALGRTTAQVGPHRHELIHTHHLLDAHGYGEVTISLPGFAQWILEQGSAEIPALKERGR